MIGHCYINRKGDEVYHVPKGVVAIRNEFGFKIIHDPNALEQIAEQLVEEGEKIKKGIEKGRVLEFKVDDSLVAEFISALGEKNRKKINKTGSKIIYSAINYLEIAYPTEDYGDGEGGDSEGAANNN